MKSPTDDVLKRLDGVRELSNKWTARCPAHDDREPSLSIKEGDDGRVLFYCHAGCSPEEIVSALDLSWSDFFADEPASKKRQKKKAAEQTKDVPRWNYKRDGRAAAAYPYVDARGAEQFKVVRFEPKPGHPAHGLDKTFRPFHHAPDNPKANGKGYVMGRGGPSILYRLPRVLEAAEAGERVYVVEGEKCVHAVEELGLRGTTAPNGAKGWKEYMGEDLRGAHVVVLPDKGENGAGYAEDVARSAHGKAASVRILELPGLTENGHDIVEWIEGGGTAEELQRLAKAAPFYAPAPPEKSGKAESSSEHSDDERTQAQVLLDLAAGCDLFHTPRGEAYATYAVNGQHRTGAVSSSGFADFLRRGFYEEKGKPPSAQALQDAKGILSARARFDGAERPVHLRVAGHEGSIYVDLCNEAWEVVRVDAEGWDVVQDPPVKFRRVGGMKAMPMPVHGDTAEGLNLLRLHVRVDSDETFALLLGWLVQSLRPRGPYPVAAIHGEKGTGKSTTSRRLRALVDPSHVPIRTRPRKEQDLVIAAENGWTLAFDNLSGLQPWLSDAFCRLATGGGFGTRRLYVNREEELFFATRPLLLNGIEDLTTRPDLADRALVIALRPIPREERKTEAQLEATFAAHHPKILGALFDAVAMALRNEDQVYIDGLPRMADFATWTVAAEGAFPVEAGTFLEAYRGNQQAANETAVESDTVATAVRAMLEDAGRNTPGMWEGKTSTLLEDLKHYLPNPDRPPRDYPETYQAMGGHLRRVLPALRAVGIERVEDLGPQGRTFCLQITARREAEEAEKRSKRPAEPSNGSASPSTDAERSGVAEKKRRPSRPTNGNYSATPLPPLHDAPQSKSTAQAASSNTLSGDGSSEQVAEDEWEKI